MKHPELSQIQLTIFGPGYGESILIHVGNRRWIIIDSCLNQSDDQPAAISYLKSIGVDVSREVELIVATHWHDDHIKGLKETILQCSSAKFALPVVFVNEDFITYLKTFESSSNTDLKFKTNELFSCLKILNERNEVHKLTSQDHVIWRKNGAKFAHNKDVELLALSPSDKQVSDFLIQINKFLNFNEKDNIHTLSKPRRTIRNKNELSVAILVTIGNFSILLGADVIVTQDRDSGWNNIIEIQKDCSIKSSIYKVAHHGSKNADTEGIWTELLISAPISIVTPWIRGGKILPTEEDKNRIQEKSCVAYITSGFKQTSPDKFLQDFKNYNNLTNATSNNFKVYSGGAVNLIIDANNGKIVNTILEDGAHKL